MLIIINNEINYCLFQTIVYCLFTPFCMFDKKIFFRGISFVLLISQIPLPYFSPLSFPPLTSSLPCSQSPHPLYTVSKICKMYVGDPVVYQSRLLLSCFHVYVLSCFVFLRFPQYSVFTIHTQTV